MKLTAVTATLFAASLLGGAARANKAPGEITGVDIVEKLGDQVPKDLTFTDQTGKQVTIGSLMHDRPVIVAMVYYSCPQLCGQMLMALHKTVKQLDWTAGKEFDVITVSIDPNETSELAAKKRQGYLQALDRPYAKDAFPFLVGNEQNIAKLADSMGYKFKYVEGERQFAHIAALFVLSPQAKVARYLYGIDFPPKQVKLALFEAADGRVGTSFERTMLRCYKFDPASRRYELFITRYYRATGLALLLIVGGFPRRALAQRFETEFAFGEARITMEDLLRKFMNLPPQATDLAVGLDRLNMVIFLTTILAAVAIGAVTLIFSLQYRRTPRSPRDDRTHRSAAPRRGRILPRAARDLSLVVLHRLRSVQRAHAPT